jgi:hypothetical protein
MMAKQRVYALVGVSTATILTGCAQIFGLDSDFDEGQGGTSAAGKGGNGGIEDMASASGAGGRGGESTSGSGGGAATSGSGGGAATSGAVTSGGGGGGAGSCMPGTFKNCAYSGPAPTENKGPCKAATQSCSNGMWGACQGEVIPIAETCNGIDDDCDGSVDNGNPGGGASCATGKSGVCAAGTMTCSNSVLVCSQNLLAAVEKCDGLDNNCNGQVDEEPEGAGCITGANGICAIGHVFCDSGDLLCEPDTGPQPIDSCNGKDNNCDGIPDSTQCFVAGTHVAMANGSARSIEQVNVGDWVLGYDLGTQRLVAAPVIMTFVHPLSAHSSSIVRINENLRATANHPFYANGQWVSAEDLSPGDSLVMLDRVDGTDPHVSSGIVSSLIVESERETTYNIEVAGVHDYFAAGVLVHNKPICP